MNLRMKLQDLWQRVLSPFAADPAMDDRYFTSVGRINSAAGVDVTHESSMHVSTVYRCVRILADTFAMLSLHTYRRQVRGRLEIPDAQATRLFTKKPNPYQTAFVFKRMMMGHLALRQNAYARIVRFDNGTAQLWPLNPDRIRGPELLQSGHLKYYYRRPQDNQEESLIGDLDIMHVTGLSTDGLRGLALPDIAKDTIGLTAATEQYGSKQFSQGVRLAGVLKTEGALDDKARDYISRSFRENFGGQRGAHGVPVLEQGMEFQHIGMTSEDAQFLETRKFQVTDIARWFGLPPHLVGDVERSTSWGTGIQEQNLQFLQYSLMPWLVLWEQAIQAIFVREPDAYVRFNVDYLKRATSKTRLEEYQIGIQCGIYSPNECRELEDMNPRPGGDVYVTPLSPNQPRPGPDGSGAPPEPEPDEDEDEPTASEPQPVRPTMRMVEDPIRIDPNIWRMLKAISDARAAPEPEPEPEPQPEPEPAPDTDAVALASLAAVRATELLTEEEPLLVKAAKDYGHDQKAWNRWLHAFFGRRAVSVSKALCCSPDEAKAFCAKRRDKIMSDGLAAARSAEWVPGLAALAAGGKAC